MRKTLLFTACLLLAVMLSSCAYFMATSSEITPSNRVNQSYINRYPGNMDKGYSKFKVTDFEKNDITDIAIDLWYAANAVYNVDDVELFEMGDGVILFPDEPEYIELKNYDEIVDSIFTDNGKRQVDGTYLSHGKNTFIQRKENTVYRLGPWKTGYSYASSLEDMEVKKADQDSMLISVQFEKPGRPFEEAPNYVPEYGLADFTIKKENGIWKVEEYTFPEATVE